MDLHSLTHLLRHGQSNLFLEGNLKYAQNRKLRNILLTIDCRKLNGTNDLPPFLLIKIARACTDPHQRLQLLYLCYNSKWFTTYKRHEWLHEFCHLTWKLLSPMPFDELSMGVLLRYLVRNYNDTYFCMYFYNMTEKMIRMVAANGLYTLKSRHYNWFRLPKVPQFAPYIYAVCLSDGYLSVVPDCSERVGKFFRIVSALPIELQMRICCGGNVTAIEFEMAFATFM